jgi:CubicO group peptidase (beta-lactamase class C family)
MLAASILVALALLVPPPAAAADPPQTAAPAEQPAARMPADLAELLAPVLASSGVPALGVAVVDVDGLVGIGAAGVRVKGADDSATIDDRWHLGSCTKAMTAALAATLVRDERIRWTSTVGEVLGPSIPDLDQGWRDVTLEDLLRHRGGAPAQPPAAVWTAAWQCDESPKACRTAFVRSLLAAPPAQARGTFAYSNQGYAIAGRMLEVVAGDIAWEALLEERLMRPLGATSIGFGPPRRAAGEANPSGHAEDGSVSDVDNPNAIAPAGTVHSTLEDWSRFVRVFLRAPREGDPLRLDRATWDALLAAPDDRANPYGLGWRIAERAWGGRVITHAGSNTVWFCVAWVAPERGFAVLVACNQGGAAATKACDEVAGAAIRWFTERTKTAETAPRDPAQPAAAPR